MLRFPFWYFNTGKNIAFRKHLINVSEICNCLFLAAVIFDILRRIAERASRHLRGWECSVNLVLCGVGIPGSSGDLVSVRRFQQLIQSEGFSRSDREWFPRWIKRYAEFVGKDGQADLPLTRDLALGFSRVLLANQTPACLGMTWCQTGTSIERNLNSVGP